MNYIREKLQGQLARQAVWLIVPFFVIQVLRFGSGITLAHLLSPEIFGVMVLINTLRSGVELLSDIGIGQSIVRSQNISNPRFLDTAWTIQISRGLILTLLGLILALPIARSYNKPALISIICAMSFTFLLAGLQSPNIFIMQRDLRVRQRAAYDIISAVGSTIITVALAILWHSVWSLVGGLLFGFLFTTILTFAFPPYRLPNIALDREFTGEILHFGKWIFLSTAIYFAAMSADRLYFSSAVSLAVLGVYGVARSFSDLGLMLAQRLGSLLVFPRVAELRSRSADLADSFRNNRRLALFGAAIIVAIAIAASDQVVLLLYDKRYIGAAFMLPILMLGVWFSTLAVFSESTLFGLDRPSAAAFGNAAKLIVLVSLLPIVVPKYGFFAGLLTVCGAEFARWAVLALTLRRERLAPIIDDVTLTILIVAVAAVLKVALSAAGAVPSWSEWWALGAALRT